MRPAGRHPRAAQGRIIGASRMLTRSHEQYMRISGFYQRISKPLHKSAGKPAGGIHGAMARGGPASAIRRASNGVRSIVWLAGSTALAV